MVEEEYKKGLERARQLIKDFTSKGKLDEEEFSKYLRDPNWWYRGDPYELLALGDSKELPNRIRKLAYEAAYHRFSGYSHDAIESIDKDRLYDSLGNELQYSKEGCHFLRKHILDNMEDFKKGTSPFDKSQLADIQKLAYDDLFKLDIALDKYEKRLKELQKKAK